MLTIGHPYTLLSEVESTNNYVADHPQLSDMTDGTAILTYHQTKGRGQRGRNWEMGQGLDLAVSYLFRPNISVNRAFDVNKAVTVALRNCISSWVGGETSIKWPNDIFIRDKKCAGILIEPSWKGNRCKHMIVGIGVNVNSSVEHLPAGAASISSTTGECLDLFQFFESLNEALTEQYKLLTKGGAVQINDQYDRCLLGFGKVLNIEGEAGNFRGRIIGADAQGRLCVGLDDEVQACPHGSVTVDYSGIVRQ